MSFTRSKFRQRMMLAVSLLFATLSASSQADRAAHNMARIHQEIADGEAARSLADSPRRRTSALIEEPTGPDSDDTTGEIDSSGVGPLPGGPGGAPGVDASPKVTDTWCKLSQRCRQVDAWLRDLDNQPADSDDPAMSTDTQYHDNARQHATQTSFEQAQVCAMLIGLGADNPNRDVGRPVADVNVLHRGIVPSHTARPSGSSHDPPQDLQADDPAHSDDDQATFYSVEDSIAEEINQQQLVAIGADEEPADDEDDDHEELVMIVADEIVHVGQDLVQAPRRRGAARPQVPLVWIPVRGEVVIVRMSLDSRRYLRGQMPHGDKCAGVIEAITDDGHLRVRLKANYEIVQVLERRRRRLRFRRRRVIGRRVIGEVVIIPRDDFNGAMEMIVEVHPESPQVWQMQVWKANTVRQEEIDRIIAEVARQDALDRAPRAIASGRSGLLEIEDGAPPPPLALLDDPRSRDELIRHIEAQTRELEEERRRLDRAAEAARQQDAELAEYRRQSFLNGQRHFADQVLIREARAQKDELRDHLLQAADAIRELQRTVALYQGRSRELSELSGQGPAGIERLQNQVRIQMDAVSRIQNHLAEHAASSNKCQVCFADDADTVMSPCGHPICERCKNLHFVAQRTAAYTDGEYPPQLETCPFCRVPVTQAQQIRRV